MWPVWTAVAITTGLVGRFPFRPNAFFLSFVLPEVYVLCIYENKKDLTCVFFLFISLPYIREI